MQIVADNHHHHHHHQFLLVVAVLYVCQCPDLLYLSIYLSVNTCACAAAVAAAVAAEEGVGEQRTFSYGRRGTETAQKRKKTCTTNIIDLQAVWLDILPESGLPICRFSTVIVTVTVTVIE